MEEKRTRYVQPVRRYSSTRIYGVITKKTTARTWGILKVAGAQGWQPYRLHVPTVMKCGILNLLEPSGSVQACTGVASALPDKSYTMWRYAVNEVEAHAQKKSKHWTFNIHIHTVQHLDIIKVLFIHHLMHQWIVLKTILKFTLKFTLKQLRHVSVQSVTPSSGRALIRAC
jgi:phage-related protein